jgi:hypothetical protein
VDCVKTENYDTGYVTVVRADTGEIIESRPMNADERQRKLNLFPESADEEDHDQDEEQGNLGAGPEGEE